MARMLAAMRRSRSRFIERNPIEVIFTRVERTPNPATGGRSVTERVMPPIRCRITSVRVDVALAGEVTTDVGSYVYGNRYALVCPWTADVKAGGQVRDQVDLPGYGSFSVREVVVETWESAVYGKVAHLEVRQ